jgi:hypothetical protein
MTNSYSSSVKYADLTPKSLASAFIVPTGGFVRLPERSWDRDGADNLMLASWSAAMVSAPGLGPRWDGYAVSISRLSRAEK